MYIIDHITIHYCVLYITITTIVGLCVLLCIMNRELLYLYNFHIIVVSIQFSKFWQTKKLYLLDESINVSCTGSMALCLGDISVLLISCFYHEKHNCFTHTTACTLLYMWPDVQTASYTCFQPLKLKTKFGDKTFLSLYYNMSEKFSSAAYSQLKLRMSHRNHKLSTCIKTFSADLVTYNSYTV